MDNIVYAVWATYTTTAGKKCKSRAVLKPTMAEALEIVTACRRTHTIAQEYGSVKYFTIHLEEQHLEPSKEATA